MEKKHYFLVGIGGISMSAIAKFLILQGNIVSGSDIVINDEIKKLQKMGANIIIGQNKNNITSKVDALIYTSAANQPNSPGLKEIQKARKLGIKTYKRSEFIGELMKEKIGVSIAGMHGKTTTTAIIGDVFKKMGGKQVVFLGGEHMGFSHGNLDYPSGGYKKAEYIISEACEYDRSFLDFKTDIAIITNIEAEHLDYFKGGLKEILDVFKNFVKKIPAKGVLIYNADDKNIQKIISDVKCKKIPYSKNDLKIRSLNLNIPGEFNQMNALAVLKLIEYLGLDINKYLKYLKDFKGVDRRFEILGKVKNTQFIDDYAHHPTEIKNTLAVLNEFYGGKKLVIFQPHQYSRTKLLFDDFVQALKLAKNLLIIEVYEVLGREEDKSVGSKELVNEIKKINPKTRYLPNYKEAVIFLENNFKKYDIILTMGAGPVNEVVKEFIFKKGKVWK